MASTTSALRYSSYRQYGKAQESSDSVSHTIVTDHDILQATCVAPAQMIKSDTNDADQKSDAFELIQRSQILEVQSVTSQDDSVVTTSSTWCLCPHEHCKRSQVRGFSQPSYLAQHMRQVHSEVPVSDERDNQRTKSFLPRLPPSAEDAKSDNTPSVLALARPVAFKAREHQSTLWTKINDPPTDSASQRARLGRYTKNHTLPTFWKTGGRAAYDTTGVAKPHPPSTDNSKQQKYISQAIIRNKASFNHNSCQSNDARYFPSASVLLPSSPRGTSRGAYGARKSIVSTLLADGIGRSKMAAGTRSLNICMSGEPTVKQSCHNKGGPLGRKPTVPDLLALWTTIRDI